MALVECVPNFSEGRDRAVLEAIVAAIEGVAGVRILDASQDPDHHRAVVTLVAPPAAVGDAAFEGVRVATERIDLTRHRGVHPRMGATDVCPFVPLEGTRLADCGRIAHALGERVGGELAVPVYYYGEAATTPERRALPAVRRGFESLRERVREGAAGHAPDAGPAELHPTAGAIAIGVRGFLIAFNVNLDTRDLAVAREIARAVRESSGGLPGIRALGLPLEKAGAVQVSMNVCDFERTGLVRVFEEVAALAREHGVEVRESELIGLAPERALNEEVARRVRLASFDPERQIVERAARA